MIIAVLAAVGGMGTPALMACGDKFLSLTKGTRFDQPARRRSPAHIVIYARPGSGLPKSLADLPIEATLRKAGYTTGVITSHAAFERALLNTQTDLILLDLVDVPSAVPRSVDALGPDLLPVVFGRKDADVKAALKRFTCAVTSSGRNQSFLDAVDEAMERRRTSASVATSRAGEIAPQ